jgi:hypothetical protein
MLNKVIPVSETGMINQARQKSLERASIQVYQQISAGAPIEYIHAQIGKLDIEIDEAVWVWERGKERYFGYQHHLREMNRFHGRHLMLGGLGMFALVSCLIYFLGWPTVPRQVGQAYIGFLIAAGGFLYGGYIWVTATPEGIRTDLG